MKKKNKNVNILDRDKLSEKIIDIYSVDVFEQKLREEISEELADNLIYAFERMTENLNNEELLDLAEQYNIDIKEYFDEEQRGSIW